MIMINEKELKLKLKKYTYNQLINLYVSTRKQIAKLKSTNEVLEVERDYWMSEHSKMVKKIKDISKELILTKKELLESKGE